MSSIELARRAVRCKYWRWMPGMAVYSANSESWLRIEGPGFDGILVAPSPEGMIELYYKRASFGVPFPDHDNIPDLTDPATLGCLLHLVREVRQDPSWQPSCGGDDVWWIEQPTMFRQTSHESYASALVAALEAAP